MAKEKADEQAHERNERVVASWARHVGVLTYFIAGSSIASAIIFGFQGCEMNGQLNAMDDQASITKDQIRADVKLIGVTAQAITEDNKIIGFDIAPTLRNSGGTDAVNVLYDWRLFGLIGPLLTPPPKCPILPRGQTGDPTILGPNGDIEELPKALPLVHAQTFEAGGGYLWAIGHFTYNDIFKGDPTFKESWCVGIVPNDASKGVFTFANMYDQAK